MTFQVFPKNYLDITIIWMVLLVLFGWYCYLNGTIISKSFVPLLSVWPVIFSLKLETPLVILTVNHQ